MKDNNNWCIDSGTTNHITNYKDWIQNFETCEGQIIIISDNSNLRGTGKGYVNVNLPNDSQIRTISNVLYVPKLSTNLLSVSSLVQKRHTIIFDDAKCNIYLKNNCKIVATPCVTASLINDLYKLNATPAHQVLVLVTNQLSYIL